MNDLEFCIATRRSEFPAFVRVLKALPQDRLDFRPDPKARTAAALAWTLVQEEAALVSMLDTGSVAWGDDPPPARIDDMVAAYERHAPGVTQRLEALDEAGWRKPAKILLGAGAWEKTISHFVWTFLLDGIHHRGQLSTYLRPMGSKVPQIYGPSADDPGQ